MSLDNIQLPAAVLHSLFKHSLTALAEKKTNPVKTAPAIINTLGNNRKNILIIVDNTSEAYLPDDQLTFLLGILSACQLTMEDVAIFNLHQHPSADYKLLGNELKPDKILLFGVAPAGIALPLDFPAYQVQRFNQQTYLGAPLLAELQNDKAEKTKLWNCLKQIFEL